MKFLRNDFSDHPVFTHIEVESREQEVNNNLASRRQDGATLWSPRAAEARSLTRPGTGY